MNERESLSSRLGFLLLSAGCAIGIGNVWRFPYITGECGGGIFVIIYLLFLCILGIPIVTMEYAVGRASRKSILPAFKALEPKNSKWHLIGYLAMAGNYILLMYYSVVSGWFLYYFYLMIKGEFVNINSEAVKSIHDNMLASPSILIGAMLCIMILTILICSAGLEKSVEKITKYMMLVLIVLMLVLGIRSLSLPAAKEGLSFYLKPSLDNIKNTGIIKIIYYALNQSFFTLSIGIGSMLIFGSYIGKERSLLGEASIVAGLDTFVAFVSGLIIFPACFNYGIAPDQGPSLIFLTLPRVFSSMPGGRIWGSLFFLFLTFAALSTMIGVFENDISFAIDILKVSRKKAALFTGLVITLGSVPCALGYNLLKSVLPSSSENLIFDIEDFFVSKLCLPLGSLVFILFCTSKYGWGFDKYLTEINTGAGIKMPRFLSFYFKYILPLVVAFIAIYGLFN